MKKLIYAVKQSNMGQYVNKVGKYLKDNIDGAFKLQFRPMESEVTMRMYYQSLSDPDSFDEMHFIINITSYQNKLRINITEDTEFEKTIGQIILFPEELNDLHLVKVKVLNQLKKAISKEYTDYDFVY